MTEHSRVARDSIRRYYDENTKLFLRFGRENETYTIHRALWFQGITAAPDALNASNALLRAEIETWRAAHPQYARAQMLDLGCGVGGTLFYLLERDASLRGIGVTLSAVQAEIARARANEIRLAERALIVQGDFQAIPAAQNFDLVYSIEAFVHATQPTEYFHQVARVLKPGGRFILCDDFRVESRAQNQHARAWLDAYERGWHVPQLQTLVQVQHMANENGLQLVTNRELTPYLKLRALPNFIARAIRDIGARLPFHHPIVPSMLGSMALQQCLQMGWIEYRWLVWEKPA